MLTGIEAIHSAVQRISHIADAQLEEEHIEKVTHLVAPRGSLKPTVKLLCGVSCCDHIVDERWLEESASQGKAIALLNEKEQQKFCLKDLKAQQKWHFDLQQTMYRHSKAQRQSLLVGLEFFITPHKSILPPVKDLVKIIECAGGKVRTKGVASALEVVISSAEALQMATVRQKMLQNANPLRIYSTELILSSILQQKVDLETNLLTFSQENKEKEHKTRKRKS